MSTMLIHRDVVDAVGSSEHLVVLHIEVPDEYAAVFAFPTEAISTALLTKIIRDALTERGLLIRSLHGACGGGRFNSSTYLFDVRNGRAAAAEIKRLMADAELTGGGPALLVVCEIAWWNEG